MVDREMSRRSLAGALAIILGSASVLLISKSAFDTEGLTPRLLLVSILANGLRIVLASLFSRIYTRAPSLWRSLFFGLSTGNAAFWGIGSAHLQFFQSGHLGTSLVLLITVAMGAGAATSLAPNRLHMRIYISTLLLPGLFFACLPGAHEALPLALLHLAFWGFLWIHGGQNHLTLWNYWTSLERLEENTKTLERVSREAKAASDAKSRFLANMSHEIRTPMNGVLGMAQLLLGTPLQADQRNMVATLKTSGEHLLRLLNDVLDLSRIEAGRIDLVTEPSSMSELTSQVARMMEPHLHGKGLRLDLKMGLPRDQRHHVDGLRYRQILANLLSNAAKFTEKGSIEVRLELLQPEGIVLEVQDTGIGIPKDKLAEIFEVFSQADASPTRQHSGTGLGLAISRQLVQLMKGNIYVTSEVGVGTLFRVALPLQPAEPLAPQEVAIERAKKKAEETDYFPKTQIHPSARILVVEDHPINRKVVAAMLENLGYSPTLVDNATSALKDLAENSFDLVFMDCQMPFLDGYEATRRLRSSGGLNRDIPVVAFTANAMLGDKERCIAAGMNDFLAKPVQMSALESICLRWLPNQATGNR
jgi:signal transduction histidine kinase/CheY-like chemotaxis protein